tara:strand:+ start:238 stop:468 length:231 start_codon:yes stop_codon:yes gene_type:complete
MFKTMDEYKTMAVFLKRVDTNKKFRKFFYDAVMKLDQTGLAFFVDAYLDNYMKRQGIKELTKKINNPFLERVYEDD